MQADRVVRLLLILMWDRADGSGDDPLLLAAYDIASFSHVAASLPLTKVARAAGEDLLSGLLTSVEEAALAAIGNGDFDVLATNAVASEARRVAKSLR